jgi:hypothetical protein
VRDEIPDARGVQLERIALAQVAEDRRVAAEVDELGSANLKELGWYADDETESG